MLQSTDAPIYLLLKCVWISMMNSLMAVDFKLMVLILLCMLIRVMAYHTEV